MSRSRIAQAGFSHLAVVLLIVVLGVVGFAGWQVYSKNKNRDTKQTGYTNPPPAAEKSSGEAVRWSFDGENWKASGTPPACPDPLTMPSPVNVALATNILYPGQTRGGDYKAHGGFRFDGLKNSDVIVVLPMDARLTGGIRYVEAGEVQYMFDFITPCGIRFRFDHLLTLSETFQKIADKLPPATEDTRSNGFNQEQDFKAGTNIATAVGHTLPSPNVGVDFGVYDLRQRNAASKNASFAAAQASKKEQTYYAVCWLDLLGKDTARVKTLPGAGTEGKTSDYCQ